MAVSTHETKMEMVAPPFLFKTVQKRTRKWKQKWTGSIHYLDMLLVMSGQRHKLKLDAFINLLLIEGN